MAIHSHGVPATKRKPKKVVKRPTKRKGAKRG